MKRKLMIFQSETTKAVYCWNGIQVVTVTDSEERPIGKIMEGIEDNLLHGAYESGLKAFWVGSARYLILNRNEIEF